MNQIDMQVPARGNAILQGQHKGVRSEAQVGQSFSGKTRAVGILTLLRQGFGGQALDLVDSRVLHSVGRQEAFASGKFLSHLPKLQKSSLEKERGDSSPRFGGILERRFLSVLSVVVLSAVLMHSTVRAEKPSGDKPAAAVVYHTNSMSGWTVLIHPQLLEKQRAATEKALGLLRIQLQEIVRKVPAPAVAKLREVTLWFSPEYAGVKPRAEYHPDEKWLRENGRNPSMAKGVEFTDIRNFEAETIRMPNFTLHELAHAYHDRVLERGFGNDEIKAAYKRVRANGIYDKVERWFGNGPPNTHEKAYAMSSPMEYFAETSEAFFSRNDFFPFTREELKKHDPEMELLLVKLWGVESNK